MYNYNVMFKLSTETHFVVLKINFKYNIMTSNQINTIRDIWSQVVSVTKVLLQQPLVKYLNWFDLCKTINILFHTIELRI